MKGGKTAARSIRATETKCGSHCGCLPSSCLIQGSVAQIVHTQYNHRVPLSSQMGISNSFSPTGCTWGGVLHQKWFLQQSVNSGSFGGWGCQASGLLVAQSCATLCDSMDYGQSGSSVHGILQARILRWVVIPFSRASSQPRDQTRSHALQADSLPPESPDSVLLKRSSKGFPGRTQTQTTVTSPCFWDPNNVSLWKQSLTTWQNHFLVINWKLIGSISLSGSNYLSPSKGCGESY